MSRKSSAKQLQIINRTSYFKSVIAGFGVSKFDRPGEMEAISDHHFWMFAMYRNDHRSIVEQRINGCVDQTQRQIFKKLNKAWFCLVMTI